MQPIELRVNLRKTPAGVFYTVDKVWPGPGNVSFGQRKFSTFHEARQWAKLEWPKVPLLRSF